MIIQIDKKEIVTKINFNLSLTDEEIKTFKSILNLAEHEIYSRRVNPIIFNKELNMIEIIKEEIK